MADFRRFKKLTFWQEELWYTVLWISCAMMCKEVVLARLSSLLFVFSSDDCYKSGVLSWYCIVCFKFGQTLVDLSIVGICNSKLAATLCRLSVTTHYVKLRCYFTGCLVISLHWIRFLHLVCFLLGEHQWGCHCPWPPNRGIGCPCACHSPPQHAEDSEQEGHCSTVCWGWYGCCSQRWKHSVLA